jgi:hypothetical protein
LCIRVQLKDDFLDPNENMKYGPFQTSPYSRSYYGLDNSGEHSIKSDRCCLSSSHGATNLFLDREEQFYVIMDSGTVIVDEVKVQITGVIE